LKVVRRREFQVVFGDEVIPREGVESFLNSLLAKTDLDMSDPERGNCKAKTVFIPKSPAVTGDPGGKS